jgi:hypothetical protein
MPIPNTIIARLTARSRVRLVELAEQADEHRARAQNYARALSEVTGQEAAQEKGSEARSALALEVARIREKLDTEQAAHAHLSWIVTAVQTFVAGLSVAAVLEDHDPPVKMVLSNGEHAESAVDDLRERIDRFKSERARVARAVPDLDYLRHRVRAQVEAMAARGRPLVAIGGDDVVVRSQRQPSAATQRSEDAALCALAWLHQAEVADALIADIDKMHAMEVARGARVMSGEEKHVAIQKLDCEILLLEHEELRVINSASVFGQHIPLRQDMDPRAILGVRVPVKRKIAA